MKGKKHNIILAIIIFVTMVIVGITVLLYKSNFFDSINAISSFAIQVISLGLSVTALVIAIVTYSSIDSVNMISSMEGNVLENENYSIAYSELVINYSSCKTLKELQDKLFQDNINNIKYKSNTCIEFADNLQGVVDSILWFAYVDLKSPEATRKAKELTDLLDKKYAEFDKITNGNQYLLQESIKLIKYVLYYQGKRSKADTDPKYDLINIRGRLLRNPISKIVYYDYLGLSYNVKAMNLVRELCGIEGQVFYPENLKAVQNKDFGENLENIKLYLDKAHKAFSMAMELSEDEIIWEGYIKYNLARVELIKTLIEKQDFNQWETLIKEAILARHRILVVFGDLVGEQAESYLIESFEMEMNLARAVELSYRVSIKEKPQRVEEDLEKLTRYQGINKSIDSYIKEINNFI